MGSLRRALPVIAIAAFALSVVVVIGVAGSTLGYDYEAYVGAARRLVAGQPLYDTSVAVAGPFAIYLYPPPFAVAFIPFTWLPATAAVAVWIAVCIAMVVAAIAILPVRAEVRWLVLLLAALDWPVLYAIKLGQVGPLLLLLLAAGWRWLDRPPIVGTVVGAGALVKVQPALLFGWAVLTRRWTTVGWGLAAIAVLAVVTLPVVGVGAWPDFVRLLGRVSAPITTPHNFTVGAVAYQAGVAEGTAALLQGVATAVVLIFAAFACLRRPADVGYLTTAVASQLVSPLLWDHYAIVLLLPTAWLLSRGHWWAVAIPLATSVLLVGWLPPLVYPVVFGVALVAPAMLSSRQASA